MHWKLLWICMYISTAVVAQEQSISVPPTRLPGGLRLVDSVRVRLPAVSSAYGQPYFRASKNFLYYLVTDSVNRPTSLVVYNLQNGQYASTIKLPAPPKRVFTQNIAIVAAGDQLYLGYGERSFLGVRLQLGPQTPDTLRFDGKFNGQLYALNLFRKNQYYTTLPDGRWLIPVVNNPGRYQYQVSKRFIRFSPQVLAVCRRGGGSLVIERLIGKRDAIYRRYLLPKLNAAYYAVNEQKATVFVGQEASQMLAEYTWTGELVATMGQAAQHPGIRATPRRVGLAVGWVRRSFAQVRTQTESPSYQFVCYDSRNDLLFRTYKEAVTDTRSLPAFAAEERAVPVACGTVSRIIPQAQLGIDQERNRPTHVQIYQNQQLIAEESLPRGFQLLKAEAGKLLGVGVPDFDHKTVKLYTYTYRTAPAIEDAAKEVTGRN